MTTSFVDIAEEVAEDVAKYGAEVIELAVRTLAPDGRGFGQERLNEREELRRYVDTLRGNAQAWDAWIQERTKKIVNTLVEAGVPEDIAYRVHPFDIVQSQAISYSDEMERRLRAEEDKARKALNSAVRQEQVAPAMSFAALPSFAGVTGYE